MDINIIAFLLAFLPLIGASIVGFNTSKISFKVAQILTTSLVGISAICSIYIFHHLVYENGQTIHLTILRWFDSGDFIANWALYIDVLSSSMLVLVTCVSSLVHLYSIGYMSDDPFKQRFMSYLSLFTFCMIMLVTADNFLQMFFGWEGVGTCSYLLIGFWFKKQTANSAAIKAFLVNRVGDIGFALGIFFIFLMFNSVEYSSVFSAATIVNGETINILGCEAYVITPICLLLFIGAMGKSAQIGLHTWLPDAMEGPTPVSALIHAATMVTAGVFMVARCSPLFEYSETALAVVTMVGATTCLFAASVALVQNDIKRIIAYSTCSQLGYMFFACGVSAYAAGIFHLLTHGFFKALLFLGAGSVIHALSNEQDINKMGGIWKLIPFTYVMMWIGSLALAGIYPFAGYFSKDIVLESAYASGNVTGLLAYWMGIIAAVLTAFYSWRLLILTFHGKARTSDEVMSHVHESPMNMTIPLFMLSIGAITSGYFGYEILGIVDPSGNFWKGAIFVLEDNNSLYHAHHAPYWVAKLPLVAGIIGITAAYVCYMFCPKITHANSKRIYNFLLNKWYFDELYESAFVRPTKKLGKFLWSSTDTVFIDGMPNGAASMSHVFARVVSFFQSGFIYHYAFVMLIGLLCMMTWILFIMV